MSINAPLLDSSSGGIRRRDRPLVNPAGEVSLNDVIFYIIMVILSQLNLCILNLVQSWKLIWGILLATITGTRWRRFHTQSQLWHPTTWRNGSDHVDLHRCFERTLAWIYYVARCRDHEADNIICYGDKYDVLGLVHLLVTRICSAHTLECYCASSRVAI